LPPSPLSLRAPPPHPAEAHRASQMDQPTHTAAALASMLPCPPTRLAASALARTVCAAIILGGIPGPAAASTAQAGNAALEPSSATTRALADDASPASAPHPPTPGPPGEGSSVATGQAGTPSSATGAGSGGLGTGGAASNSAGPALGASAGPGVSNSAEPGVGNSSAEAAAAQAPQPRQFRQLPQPPRPAGAAPAWDALNASQQQWLAPLARVWHELPASDRHAWIQLSRQLPRLSQQAQAQARERMQQWSAFTPQQRQAARENFRLARKLNESSLSQGQLQALWDRYQELTPEQRAVLRAAGQTATTAARHAGAATPLAKEASRPLPPVDRHGRMAQ
ncbi:MAG: DUF3106 domain-containing protein, partial [Betaproteobacteria bacterium]